MKLDWNFSFIALLVGVLLVGCSKSVDTVSQPVIDESNTSVLPETSEVSALEDPSELSNISDMNLDAEQIAAENQITSKDAMLHSTNYQTVKTGASVSFETDYVGPSAVGEWIDLELTYISAYEQADLAVTVTAMENLEMLPITISEKASLGHLESMTIAVSVKSDIPGVYYLSSVVDAETPQGKHEARAFAQSIHIGNLSEDANAAKQKILAEGDKVIMPAAEEIID